MRPQRIRRRTHARSRAPEHHVRLDAGLLPEFPTEFAPDLVDEVLVDGRVRSREVDVFEEAIGRVLRFDELIGVVAGAVGVQDDEFAGLTSRISSPSSVSMAADSEART